MATTTAAGRPRPRKISLVPDAYDRLLSVVALVLLAAVLAALWRGRREWAAVPPFVWLHIATIVVAVALTPVMLLRRRGDRLHRRLGWLWVGAMALTAAFSFAIREMMDGELGPIHVLSALTILTLPLIVCSARSHRHRAHRSAVRGLVTGALVVAGLFTFPFGRLLGRWLFG
ncbi:MAG: hypothetical protein M3N07_05040 [Pseudomonadota bacterium]|nr:hypothetical protein [Pseudomonadota bacterium]